MSQITNYLSPASFDVSIAKFPELEFFTQQIAIPDISSQAAEVVSPLKRLYNIPDTLVYSPLQFQFIVDENMKNYTEVLNWLEGMGAPEIRGDQYQRFIRENDSFLSDITVIIRNSHKNPNVRFLFKDCFPTSIGTIDLNIATEDIQYVTCTAGFAYNGFTIERVEP